ncbi:MAG: RnfH family protein [Pseudomonadota bacterium]
MALSFKVEVAYATPAEQRVVGLEVPKGTTVRGVIERSRLLDEFPEINLARNAVGIFGRRLALETLVSDGDRVEIYRPLHQDPKERRRQRLS